jgi:hypothetical protein
MQQQETPEERNKVVLFVNFSDQVFSSVKPHEVRGGQMGKPMMIVDENCKWAGEDYTFEAGSSRYMPKWKADHFARHLVNRELLRVGMDNDTSPKRPTHNPRYMALYNKAVIVDPEAMPISESKSEEEAMNLNKDAEIAALRAENERLNSVIDPSIEIPKTDDTKKVAEIVPEGKGKAEERSELVTPIDEEEFEDDEEFGDAEGTVEGSDDKPSNK